MLNHRGGHVLFGVLDDGRIVGQDIADRTLREISNTLQHMRPSVIIEPEQVPIGDRKAVLTLHVPRGEQPPYAYKGRYYVRRGPTATEMPAGQLRALLLRQNTVSWEASTADGISIDDLDQAEIVRTVDSAIDNGRLNDPATRVPLELLRKLGLTTNGTLVNAAMVLFGREDVLQFRYPQCKLHLARFRGTTKEQFEDHRQVSGNLFELLQQGQTFLRQHLPVAGRIIPGVIERSDEPIYPLTALREALANALCHRDYMSRGGSVSIAIYDDRLEISNAGTLPPELTIEMLRRDHRSVPRNPLIAQVLYRRGVIEQWGSGTTKMLKLSADAGLEAPEFAEDGGGFMVSFRSSTYVAPRTVLQDLSQIERQLLEVLADHGPLGVKEIGELTDLPRRTIQDNLKRLQHMHLADFSGKGRGAKWHKS